jgi:hypothetical protein
MLRESNLSFRVLKTINMNKVFSQSIAPLRERWQNKNKEELYSLVSINEICSEYGSLDSFSRHVKNHLNCEYRYDKSTTAFLQRFADKKFTKEELYNLFRFSKHRIASLIYEDNNRYYLSIHLVKPFYNDYNLINDFFKNTVSFN